jgi:signal peptidase I
VSGTPRDGESGWLRYEAEQPDPAPVETDSGDSAWLRHDLPDPSATDAADRADATGAPEPGAATDATSRPPESPWLPSDVEVARTTPTSGAAHDTGVRPTIVVETEESTPMHPSSATRPLPDQMLAAAAASGSVGAWDSDAASPDAASPDAASPDAEGPDADDSPAGGPHGADGSDALGDPRVVEADEVGAERRGGDDESVGGLAVLGAAIKEFAIVVGMALVLSFIVKTWLLQAFYIPSGSMEDTLVLNDRVIVSKLTPGPVDLKRGDIIVFADPGQWLDETPKAEQGPVATVVTETLTFVGLLPDNAENHLIKRVIGLPGDHVVCCDEGGRITINGTAIKEPYLKPGDAASEQDFDITVPKGRVWVMGDHRSNSADSRVHDGPENDGSQGSVDERLIVGRAVALVWPLDHLTWLSNPTATFAHVPAPSAATGAKPQGAGVPGVPVGDGPSAGPGDDPSAGPSGGEVGGTDTPTGSG